MKIGVKSINKKDRIRMIVRKCLLPLMVYLEHNYCFATSII